jgi:hypothetical protein
MKTTGGQQAERIAKWAWDDPAARVADAIARVNELARSSQDPAELTEIQDQGTYLSRLAGSLDVQLPGDSFISGQLRGQE